MSAGAGMSPARYCLVRRQCRGWVYVSSKPPFAGTTMEENIGAAAVELTPGDLREIESAASKVRIEGDRYPENLERMTGR